MRAGEEKRGRREKGEKGKGREPVNTVSTFAPTSHTRSSDWWLTSGRVKHGVLFKPQSVLLTLLNYHRVLGGREKLICHQPDMREEEEYSHLPRPPLEFYLTV